MTLIELILILTKISLYLNMLNIDKVIAHHTLKDAEECSIKVLESAKMYDFETTTKCSCNITRKTDYYQYKCDCQIKDKDGTLLQGGGSRILYEEKDTYKLRYNFWIKENDWYTGYCEELK